MSQLVSIDRKIWHRVNDQPDSAPSLACNYSKITNDLMYSVSAIGVGTLDVISARHVLKIKSASGRLCKKCYPP